MDELDKLSAMVAAMMFYPGIWDENSLTEAVVKHAPSRASIVALVNTAPDLIALARIGLQVLAASGEVLSAAGVKFRDGDAT